MAVAIAPTTQTIPPSVSPGALHTVRERSSVAAVARRALLLSQALWLHTACSAACQRPCTRSVVWKGLGRLGRGALRCSQADRGLPERERELGGQRQ